MARDMVGTAFGAESSKAANSKAYQTDPTEASQRGEDGADKCSYTGSKCRLSRFLALPYLNRLGRTVLPRLFHQQTTPPASAR